MSAARREKPAEKGRPPAGTGTYDPVFGITTGAVARHLGVSPTTVRSWEQRYGIAPAAREGGRHRRWTPEDVAMLDEMCKLTSTGVPPGEAARVAIAHRAPTAPEAPRSPAETIPHAARAQSTHSSTAGSGLPLGAVRPECRGLARAAVRLDSPAIEAMLDDVMRDHDLVTAWDEVMAPTLHAVGRKWGTTEDRYVEVEHLLSWHVSTALRKASVSASREDVDGAPVLLACTPAEQHTLPLEALAAGLAERGRPMRMFGAAVPADALDEAVRRLGPVAVALWSQSRTTADTALARRVAQTGFGLKGARHAPRVLLLGPGWPASAVGAGMSRPKGLREAIETVSRLYTEPAARATA
ncbi:MerR family transcriptional regulator [Streptomyces virginiae]|uniref:MerR family transcriptional regulator n=1 Tax=Streptomyces virginiae TaxID=1961 RepID=UPI0036BEBEF5